jgi:two-component system LytT family response regulator
MVRLKTIVVDDEALSRKLLLACLRDLQEIELVAECANGREAVAAVQEFEPDLMFLDINMPGLNGFGVITKIQPELLPMVIFCTAYQRYALDAFEVHAVDYIVKPIDEERLQLAVQRALVRHQQGSEAGDRKAPLLGALDTITETARSRLPVSNEGDPGDMPHTTVRKITIKDRDAIKLVKVDDISWVDAAGDYMCVHTADETHIMRCTMKHLMAQLDERVFKRVHRSTIVNLDYVEAVIPHTKGECFLQLDNGERVKVSRKYRSTIRDFLDSLG